MVSKNSFCLLSCFMFFFVAPIHAQDSLKKSEPQYLQASLLYDFPKIYGIVVSGDKPFFSYTKKKNFNKANVRVRERVYFVAGSLGMYRYPLNYTGVFLLPTAGIRYYKSSSFSELSYAMGILRTFYDGTVYEVLPGGNIKTLPLFGRYYALSSLSFAWYWQLRKKYSKALYAFIKPSLWLQYPYDSFIKAHVSLQLGISYSYRNVFVKSRIKIK